MFRAALSIAALAAVSLPAQQPITIENAWVRVVKAANIPGRLSRPHVHTINRVMIHLDKGVLRIDNKETGIARDIPFTAGEVRWDPRVGVHTSENVGGTHIRIVEIELNDAPPRRAGFDPNPTLPPAAARYAPVLENNQTRILRLRLAPGESARESSFPGPAVATRLGDGETVWLAANEAIENKASEPAEWILVELK